MDTTRGRLPVTVIEIPTPDPRTLDDDSRLFAEAVRDRYAITNGEPT